MRIKEETVDLGGKKLLLRAPKEEDAELLIDYLKTVCGETRFLSRDPEEVRYTVEGEKEFIKNKNDSDREMMILAFLDGEFVGNCSLGSLGGARRAHSAEFGIGLFLRFTSMGIGTVLLEKSIELAREMGFEQLELKVVASNVRGIGLYTKMGFVECGRIPNSEKYTDGTYDDMVIMVKDLRSCEN